VSVASTIAGLAGSTSEPQPVDAGPARARIVAVVLVVGAITPAASGIAAMRSSWWAWHLLGGLGVAVATITVALAVCLLVPARGVTWAILGALLTGLGGLAFYGGVAAEAVPGAYATEPEALSAQSGTTLLRVVDDLEPIGALLIPAFVLLTVGALLLAGALWLARSVPRWLPVAFAFTSVARFPLSVGVVADSAFAATLAAVAWFLWHHSTTNIPRSNP
jgi:hypothetical protein